MRILIGAAAALVFTTAASAASGDNQQPANPAEKPICKRVYDADTGSHFQTSKRVCHTAAEWKEIEDGTERTMRQLRDQHGINAKDLAPVMGGSPH